ncbi:DNA-directed RNA polymerase subunit epsilon [Halococcus sp. IIIV-5B]|uniref:DNA-directed RNA polymerase subunit epsilon n=1 Tax=Halococcus sp. IIIV-5B TaxID=2321230 RepID=UPI000E73074D|nr:DNA-directed RNA polymerase subunit epsilon [Halococcus sp. IIIV-5B]RJT04750.1 DNA-directed RNA polymerase subunit epsilon [Halococcus sp. IIIV-5B]
MTDEDAGGYLLPTVEDRRPELLSGHDISPLSQLPGDSTVSRADLQRDETVRQWGLVTPSATRIGRADTPEHDLSENVRRLHDERHPAMEGYSRRAHRLEKLRLTHALCSSLDLTPWQRDRAIGTMVDLDLTAFGSQRAIPKVALVVIRHVVDREREHHLGLHDNEWIADQSPEKLADLYDQFHSITDEESFTTLCENHDLDTTSLNRLRRTLVDQLDERDLHDAVYGRNPYRDPSLPSPEIRSSA